LVAQGIESYAIDLTRPEFGVPVVRVIAPALQLDPCAIVSVRLRDAMMRCRDLGAEPAGVALF
jgi:ribosomal protein S12 methylthiotransferase accessory factor